MTTAAGIIIGDELLSGKVTDTNSARLVEMLRCVGVRLRRMTMVGDEMDDVAREVTYCAQRHDYVITSGGVGPTHDDLTMAAVARAFGCPLVRHPFIVDLVKRHFGARINEAALKLAELPEGSRLLISRESVLPVVAFRNIYILPGVPQLFCAKLEAIRAELVGQVRTLKSIFLTVDESRVADLLSQVVAEDPGVQIGSYPRLGDPEYQVRVTVEHEDPQRVERALARLLELLPPEHVLRVESGY